MLKLSVALYAVNAILSLATGVRYFSRADFMPYQAKAVGQSVGALAPGLRTVILAMLKVVGGGFLAFGFTALGLCVALWQGSPAANWGLLIGSAALLGPAGMASSSFDRLGPNMGAPVRPVYGAAAIATVAFLAALAG